MGTKNVRAANVSSVILAWAWRLHYVDEVSSKHLSKTSIST